MSAPTDIERHGHEIHVFGPPGTGKTTWVSGRVRSTAAARGSDAVLVGSFTTAAAAELAGAGLPLPKRAIGTLHSHAYRAIDAPPVAAERIPDWNKAHPALALSTGAGKSNGSGPTLDEPPEEWRGATEGDALMAQMDAMRNRRIDPALWPAQVRAFARRWSEWKRDEGVIDFTDMIEMALADTVAAPGAPEVGFFDECQDNTPLELALIRHWGQRMERIILAGDDDQSIYGFRGATPEGLLDHPVPPEDRFVLAQSHRIPASVHRAAERWVKRLSRREPKVYLPREEEGEVVTAPLRYTDPVPIVAEIEAEVDAGRDVMVLAACSYMIDPIKHALREHGVPFANPWRRKRGDWNPLTPGRGIASKDRLLAYLMVDPEVSRAYGRGNPLHPEIAPMWTGEDLKRWVHVVKTQGMLRRGAKTMIAALPDGAEVSYEQVAGMFESEADFEAALASDLGWFSDRLLAASRDGMKFPIRVAARRGPLALVTPPRVYIGTIHSFKGAQADTVILLPDLSSRGNEEWSKAGTPRDGVIRQFYVGMTRAKQRLVVCEPSGQAYVPPARLVQGAVEAAE